MIISFSTVITISSNSFITFENNSNSFKKIEFMLSEKSMIDNILLDVRKILQITDENIVSNSISTMTDPIEYIQKSTLDLNEFSSNSPHDRISDELSLLKKSTDIIYISSSNIFSLKQTLLTLDEKLENAEESFEEFNDTTRNITQNVELSSRLVFEGLESVADYRVSSDPDELREFSESKSELVELELSKIQHEHIFGIITIAEDIMTLQTKILTLDEELENAEESFEDSNHKISIFYTNQIFETKNELSKNFTDSIQNSLIILLIIFIATTTIGILFSTNFVKPIQHLKLALQEIEKGNFNIKLVAKGDDEIKDLVNSFNLMNTKLAKNLELEKNLAIEKQKVKDERFIAIGELASRLSHDIRNPLTVIKGTLDVLKVKNNSLSDDDLEKLNRIDSSVYRISHQIENVLDFIRGKPLTLSTYSFQKILDSAIHDIVKNNKIKIETKNCNVDLECDYESIKVVMINLMFNAIQAMGDKGTIQIETQTKGDQIVIDIQDDGPGIPEDMVEKIFEPLFTTKQEGTGLGLASCKSIIELHGGKISVQTNPTIFTITLPKSLNQKETILKFEK